MNMCVEKKNSFDDEKNFKALEVQYFILNSKCSKQSLNQTLKSCFVRRREEKIRAVEASSM